MPPKGKKRTPATKKEVLVKKEEENSSICKEEGSQSTDHDLGQSASQSGEVPAPTGFTHLAAMLHDDVLEGGDDAEDVDETPVVKKRGRGRPRKTSTTAEQSEAAKAETTKSKVKSPGAKTKAGKVSAKKKPVLAKIAKAKKIVKKTAAAVRKSRAASISAVAKAPVKKAKAVRATAVVAKTVPQKRGRKKASDTATSTTPAKRAKECDQVPDADALSDTDSLNTVEDDDGDVSFIDFDLTEPSIFLDNWIVYEKLAGTAQTGISYLVEHVENAEHAGTLRCVPMYMIGQITTEVEFLRKVSVLDYAHLFVVVSEFDIVEAASGEMAYIITKSRLGCSLSNCVSYAVNKWGVLSINTAVRLALEMLMVVEAVCKSGYVLLNMSLDQFAFDGNTRHVYLKDAKDVGISWERNGIEPTQKGKSLSWRGNEEHAPLGWHLDQATPMSECDSLEAWFYVVLDLRGQLPWKGKATDEIIEMKKTFRDEEPAVLNELIPSGLVSVWLEIVRGRMVYVSRGKNLTNGQLLLGGPAKRKMGKYSKFPSEQDGKKAIPKCSMIDFAVFHKSLAMNCAYASLDNCDRLFDFEEHADMRNETVAFRFDERRLLNEIQLLEHDVAVLEIGNKFTDHFEKRIARANDQNDVIIQKYVINADAKIDVDSSDNEE